MANIIVESNQRIYSEAMNGPSLHGMGTTIVALLLHPGVRTSVAHVGDSRAYRLRANSFERLTRDHSVVAELITMGAMSEAEAETDRDDGAHAPIVPDVSRSLLEIGSSVVEQSPRDDQPLDLARALVDVRNPTVAHPLFEQKLSRSAH